MKLVRSLEEMQWRDFIAQHPESNIFHTPEMFQVFEEAEGFQPKFWAVVDEKDTPLTLLLPVHITLIGGALQYMTTRAVAYGSVLYTPGSKGKNALAYLLDAYQKEVDKRVLFTELRNVSDLEVVQPILDAHNFQYEEHMNYLIDLKRSPEEIMQSFGSRTRKRIRRALRKNQVRVTEISKREEILTCYELLLASYTNAQVPLADISLFEAAYDQLHSKGMIKFYLAWVAEQCVAGSVELIYKDVIYGWYSGVDRDFSAYIPNEMLMWQILKWGAENGYRLYDFGGAGRPDEEYGVRDFKAKFAGDLVMYGRNVCTHAPVRLAISKLGYQVYRYTLGSERSF
jgi:lipid II:glycine glycyltransferase (peptidoglycan interpeptide bridge formation enzyme)